MKVLTTDERRSAVMSAMRRCIAASDAGNARDYWLSMAEVLLAVGPLFATDAALIKSLMSELRELAQKYGQSAPKEFIGVQLSGSADSANVTRTYVKPE